MPKKSPLSLSFSLDTIEEVQDTEKNLYEQAKKSRFAKVKIKLFGTGENAHTEPVSFEALKCSADSAYDIPLIAELNPYRDNKDFGGHGTLTGKEFAFGFIKNSKDNPINFEKDENTGKVFISLYGLIWKKYFKNIVDILMNNNSKTEVSVELEELGDKVSPNGKPILQQFVLNAVTFLGKVTSAACKGAEAQLCFSEENDAKFLADKKRYFEENFAGDKIEIVNSKETAINGRWANPRQKLLSPILKANNKTALLNEAYLFYDNKGQEETTLSDVSYPHHAIKDGKLVLHIRGVQAAFSRLAQQGKVEGEAKAHLIRHYRTLGLNRENFEDFGLTSEQFELYFSTDFGKEENMPEPEKEINESCGGKEESVEKEIKEEISDEKLECKEADSIEVKSEEPENHDGYHDEHDDEHDDEYNTEEDKDKKIAQLTEENCRLQKENDAYMEKIKSMSDYEELKQFKEETIKKEKEAMEMAQMNKVMESLESKGVTMSAEVKEELTKSRKDFANISAWSNYVKAYVFDNCEISNDEGIVKMDIIKPAHNDDTTSGIWARIENNI